MGQELQEGGLGHEEAQALLTICVHSYLREVVFCDRSDDIVENGSEPPGMVSNVQFLITTCARSVLEYIQNKVRHPHLLDEHINDSGNVMRCPAWAHDCYLSIISIGFKTTNRL